MLKIGKEKESENYKVGGETQKGGWREGRKLVDCTTLLPKCHPL